MHSRRCASGQRGKSGNPLVRAITKRISGARMYRAVLQTAQRHLASGPQRVTEVRQNKKKFAKIKINNFIT